ncbi:MAG: metal ABC transporter substrate-binding protein [Anaerolineae bacterium]|nr:metal ABC transporter substrate-binding protein [Anaerolineae bacterium]
MKSLKIGLKHTLLLTALVLLVGCGSSQPDQVAASSTSEKLKVVATFSILGDLVQNVGGDKIELYTLVGPGSDTHTFEPSPSDSVALVEAKLIFENGLGLETWLDKLYTASDSQAKRVAVTEGLEPIAMAEGDHEEHGAVDEHGHGEFDPHVWQDVANVIHEVEGIRDALVEADPAGAKTYQANAETYLGQLKELDAWVIAEVEKLPKGRRKLVTSHDTFGYFARRYGFDMVGSGLGSTTEAGDPSATQLVSLVEEIKGAGVLVIFVENVSNPRLMEQIAAEAGVTLGPALYTDALTEPGSDGDTYIRMMRHNVTVIVMALSQ